ncbi:MAG: DNA polymerase III subunit gamma/tau [Eubacteriales bacterium]|jgi:DNA polymerase-3 subunit gamma/tau
MYVALYRKYRPMDFSAVVGQEHITSTLKREIQEQKVAHAYLFTGTRGTGKTTCARLLAKAVNCLDLQNGEPCNQCENCRSINDGSCLDVIEIDAASNTGVDNIRDIREEAVYTPASGRKKVYIIDEVHMLSIGAFNALLKLLEEPPEHVMFILATTEAYKIAPTILSRCQRFDFRRITPAMIAQRLAYVCQQEGLEADREALFLIGRLGDGSMRDALSILDTCSGSGQRLTAEYVSKVAGVTGRESLYQMVEAMATEDVGQALRLAGELYDHCKSIALLSSELTEVLRNLMVIKAVKEPGEILGDFQYELDRLTDLAKQLSLERILYGIRLLQDLQNTLQRSQNQRIDFEVALFRLCDPTLCQTPEALLARLERAERQLENGVTVVPSGQKPSGKATQSKPSAKSVQPREEELPPWEEQPSAQPAPPKPTRSEDIHPLSGWKEIQEGVTAAVGTVYGSILREAKGYCEGDAVYVVCGSPLVKMKYQEASTRQTVEQILEGRLGRHVRLEALLQDEFERLGKMEKSQADPFAQLLKENKSNQNLRIEE